MKHVHAAINGNEIFDVKFHDLLLKYNQDVCRVFCKNNNEAIEIPTIGGKIIEFIKQENGCIFNLQKEFSDINIQEFISSMIDIGFIWKINNQCLNQKSSNKISIFSRNLSKFLVSKLFLQLLGLFFISSLFFLIINDFIYIPSGIDFLISKQYASVSIFFGTMLRMLIIYLHEYSHFLIALGFGLHPEIRFSTRLLDLVVETDVTGVLVLEKWKSCLVLLSGIIFEIIVILLSELSIFFIDDEIFTSIAKFLIISSSLSIIWQFQIYLRTDIYYILTNIFNKPNLYKKTVFVTKNIFFKLKIDKTEELDIFDFSYISFFIAGVALYLILNVTLVFPAIFYGISLALNNIIIGYNSSDIIILSDGILSFLIDMFFLLLFLFFFTKNNLSRCVFAKITSR